MQKVDKNNICDIVALSPMQKGMLYHYQKDPDCSQYFVQLRLGISGNLDLEILEKAWNLVIQKHEMLRTVFRWKKVKEPLQIILKNYEIRLSIHDLDSLPAEEQEKRLGRIREEDRENGFDLGDVPFRVTVCKLSDVRHEFIISSHHILYDGWSNGAILVDLMDAYACLSGAGACEPDPVTPFRTYIRWLKEQDKHEGIQYWKEYLRGYRQPANLSRLGSEKDQAEYGLEVYWVNLDETVSEGFKNLASELQVTPYSIFQALWGILLQRYNNTDDVVFGGVVSGRPSGIKDVNRIVGLFINMVPVRVKTNKGDLFSQLLKSVHKNAVASKSYEYLPLPEIQANSLLKDKLLDHLMSYQNYPVRNVANAHENKLFTVDSAESHEHTNYDFNFVIFPGDVYSLKIIFNANRFEPDAIKNLMAQFIGMGKQVVRDPQIPVSNIEIVNRAEQESLLNRSENKVGPTPQIEADFDF